MNRNGYTLTRPAARWEEGMLCGNGTIGAIVMGEAASERIVLAHERLVVPFNQGIEPIGMAPRLPAIRELIAAGREAEACNTIVDLYRQEHDGDDRLVWTEPFFPAAELRIATELADGCAGYRRSLDFENGEASVQFDDGDRALARRVFASRTAQACVIQLESGGLAANYELSLGEPLYTEADAEFYRSHFYAEPEFVAHASDARQAVVRIREFAGTGAGYATVAIVAACDGEVSFADAKVAIRAAKTALILVSLVVIDDLAAFSAAHEASRLSALPAAYERLLREHASVHQERYSRISLQLQDDALPADDEALWAAGRQSGSAPASFMEKIFNAGRYEILSSCGGLPPNLQGVWAGVYPVPWSSDYTQNGNVQTAISGLLPSGDFESLLSYFDYQEANLAHYRENSRRLFGCRGIHIPSRTSAGGYDIHFSTAYPMLFWTAGAAWAAHFYYDYWLYTGDDEFFRTRALPFMKEAALFYEDFLIPDADGRWLFIPSYSPENTPMHRESSATVNATMDIAVAKALFTNLIVGCRTLGLEDEPVEKWEDMLAKMPAYQVNEDGALKEWAAPQYADNYDHRHASQLYMLYYDIPEEIRRDRALYEACETTYRLKRERKKNEQGTMAFGLVQMGMAAAHLQDAEMVETMLQSMANNNYYATFASSHDYGPSLFNADISGGVPALILEAIAQSSPVTDPQGRIERYDLRLLPALPASLHGGELQGLRLRGGFSLDISWRNGVVEAYVVHNPFDRKYRIVH